MANKCLIVYASRTGNTEKVALRFKSTFERNGWECDIFKITEETDIYHPPFNYKDYDFMCAGSPVYAGLPPAEIINVLRKPPKGDPRKIAHRKIVPGPKKGVVFVTYAGSHLGPKEAEPALKLLELEMEHLKFICIGSFRCPGNPPDEDVSKCYHKDLRNRPSERDLMRAELFIEEVIEALL